LIADDEAHHDRNNDSVAASSPAPSCEIVVRSCKLNLATVFRFPSGGQVARRGDM
jgi:hypothetical protein